MDRTVVWKDPDHVTGTFLDEQRDAIWERLTATGSLADERLGVPESSVVGEDRAKSSTREPFMPNRFHRLSVLLAACVTAAPLVLTTTSPAVGADETVDASRSITLTRWTSDADFQRGARRDSRSRAVH